jgi:hypothetical protein
MTLGTDTFAGLFVPLTAPSGVTPVNNNFVSGDYSTSTGLNPGASNTSKFIDLNYSPSSWLLSNSAQISGYSRTESIDGTGPVLAGCTDDSDSSARILLHNRINPNTYFDCYTTGPGRIFGDMNSSTGLITGSRITGSVRLLRNGSQLFTDTSSGGVIPAPSVYAFALRYLGAANLYDSRIYSYFYIGLGLTNSEEADHYSAVQALQTAYGRNV